MPWTDIIAARLALVQKKQDYENALQKMQELIDYLNGKSTLSSEDSSMVDQTVAIAVPVPPSVPEV